MFLKCLNFWLTTFFLGGGMCFNRPLVYLWGTYYELLLADLLQHSYEARFFTGLLQKKREASSLVQLQFPLYVCYNVIPVLSLNNPIFKIYLDLIYPNEMKLKKQLIHFPLSHTQTFFVHSFAERLKSKLYDKRDDFDFPNCKFPLSQWQYINICSYRNIQLICIYRDCDLNMDFLGRARFCR